MRVNSIVGGGADAHKEGEAQIEQDGGGAPHIMEQVQENIFLSLREHTMIPRTLRRNVLLLYKNQQKALCLQES